MFEDLKKTIDKGVEYAFMNAEKVAQAAKDLAKENKLNTEEAKKLYEHLLAKSEEAKKTMESEIQLMIKAVLKKMEVPTQEEIKKLETAKAAPVKSKVAPKKAETAKKTVKKQA